RWARPAVELARRIRPDLVRCYGADWNGYLAFRIKTELGVPYVVSLHGNPDVDFMRQFHVNPLTLGQQRLNRLFDELERDVLSHADFVMPVYQPIIPCLERMGVTNYEVC